MISVIVPVYNKEKELPRCVDSLLNQTLSDFECILVDDGSTDLSPRLCDEYASQDQRVRVIHKSNGGLSDARNVGIKSANGNKISFIDADDYVSPLYLEILDNALNVSQDVGIAACVSKVVPVKQGQTNIVDNVSYSSAVGVSPIVLSAKETLLRLFYGEGVSISVCGRLYRKSVIDGLEFPYGYLYEDVEWSVEAIIRAKNVSVINDELYYYVMNKNSITHNTDERVFNRYELALRARSDIELLGDSCLSRAAERYVAYHALSVLRSHYPNTPQTREYTKALLVYINEIKDKLLSDKRLPKRDEIALKIISFGLLPYRLCWGIYSLMRGQ